MKKRMSLLVIASCALFSCTLASPTLGAWWNEPGPNHKAIPVPPNWHNHSHLYYLADAEVVIPGEDTPTADPAWWNETGPNH